MFLRQFQRVKLHKLHFEFVNYLYFSDLASCNPFPVSKMSGKRFGSNIEVTDTIIDYFEEKNKSYYIEHKKFEHRLIKCIELERDYIKK